MHRMDWTPQKSYMVHTNLNKDPGAADAYFSALLVRVSRVGSSDVTGDLTNALLILRISWNSVTSS